jgi:hypothetical protein
MFFAIPYSGHGWIHLGALRQKERGALLNCLLTSDFDQLAVAIRPFRAIHHLREAKILNVIARDKDSGFAKAVKDKFGTEIKVIGREQTLDRPGGKGRRTLGRGDIQILQTSLGF